MGCISGWSCSTASVNVVVASQGKPSLCGCMRTAKQRLEWTNAVTATLPGAWFAITLTCMSLADMPAHVITDFAEIVC